MWYYQADDNIWSLFLLAWKPTGQSHKTLFNFRTVYLDWNTVLCITRYKHLRHSFFSNIILLAFSKKFYKKLTQWQMRISPSKNVSVLYPVHHSLLRTNKIPKQYDRNTKAMNMYAGLLQYLYGTLCLEQHCPTLQYIHCQYKWMSMVNRCQRWWSCRTMPGRAGLVLNRCMIRMRPNIGRNDAEEVVDDGILNWILIALLQSWTNF